MILLLDTSTAECRLTLREGEIKHDYTWQADRQLADGLLAFLEEKLALHGAQLQDIEGIGVMRGPGSFTGLRIGVSVLNALASDRQIPIVGTAGDDWKEQAAARLSRGEDDKLVLPEYGRPANITRPAK